MNVMYVSSGATRLAVYGDGYRAGIQLNKEMIWLR